MTDTIKNIWDDFHKELKKFITTKVKDESVADDILQDVFVKIAEHPDKIVAAKNVQRYIYGIARNATIDHFRKSGWMKPIENEDNLISEEDVQTLNATIAECCIRPFIEQLPEKYKVALTKTEFEHVSQKELAIELNLSYSGAKSRVQRGKEKLKALILACCNFPSDRYGNLMHKGVDHRGCS